MLGLTVALKRPLSPGGNQITLTKQVTKSLKIQGREVQPEMIGFLRDADCNCDLEEQLVRDGYLLLRGLHDPEAVQAARIEILQRLVEVDEIAEPAGDGIATGRSKRAEMHSDLGAFWRSVSEGRALRDVINGPRITQAMSDLFGEPAAHFTFAWLRAMTAGRASPLHIDHPYMNRGSSALVTCWSPMGSVDLDEGPLFIVEGSHAWSELRVQFEGLDVDREPDRPGHLKESAADLARDKGARLLTTSFQPGDCLVFGMFTAHAAFDNGSTSGRVRVSCDTRFQPASHVMDERVSGPNPPAHGGLGYGCLSAARPMTGEQTLR
jgi:ectoine hydroxylase-related dioxygenase (phytanoyl-CoA dioxygenase family)